MRLLGSADQDDILGTRYAMVPVSPVQTDAEHANDLRRDRFCFHTRTPKCGNRASWTVALLYFLLHGSVNARDRQLLELDSP